MENLQIIDDYDFKDLNQAFAAVNWYKRFEFTKRGSYHFDLKKLKLNYWYKSWKEVCDDLGIEHSGGRILKEQQKIIEANTDFEKDGRKYLFRSVVKEAVVSTLDPMTSVTRADCVEVLLLSIFSEIQNHPIALTAKGWYKLLGMGDDNWRSPNDSNGVKMLSREVERNERRISGTEMLDDNKLIISDCSDISTKYFVKKTMDEFSYALKYGINSLIDQGAVSVDFVYGGYPIEDEVYERFITDETCYYLFNRSKITKDLSDEEWELYVPECIQDNFHKIDENKPSAILPMKMFNAEENTALLKYKRTAMKLLGVNRESETYQNRELRQKYYNIVNYLVLKNLHCVVPARFMVAYPFADSCINVLRTMTEREDIKALLNRKMKNGLIKSANKKRDEKPDGVYGTDGFVRALNFLMKNTMSHNCGITSDTLRLGLMNGEYFSAKNPDYRRIGQNKDRDIIGE